MRTARCVANALLLVLMSVAPFAQAQTQKALTTSVSPITGLWWNPSESGWGMSVTQHGTMIFVAWYTYDSAGKPVWYVMSSCPLVGSSCIGDVFSVTGGRAITDSWDGAQLTTNRVGTGNLAFTDNDSATFTFTVNGVSGSKRVIRQVFAAGALGTQTNYSDLWWNENESGWGAAFTQQASTIFATIFTYGANGSPVWYVASNCQMSGSGCSGALFRVSGGSSPTVVWNALGLSAVPVGNIVVTFHDNASANMRLTIDGVTNEKQISRQDFAGEGLLAESYSDVFQGIQDVSGGGGWRWRGLNVRNVASSSVGCSYGDTPPDRNTIEGLVRGAGGQITISTPTEWCGQVPGESYCLKLFGSVVVLEELSGGVAFTDVHVPGLVANRKTMISYASDLRYARVSSEWRDSSVAIGATNCNNGGQPAQPLGSINGDWIGYSVNYSRSARTLAEAVSTMSCRNQICSILGTTSGTVAFSSSTLWRTATGAARLAGASISTDQSLASAFLCNGATVDETRPFDTCTYFSFRRQ